MNCELGYRFSFFDPLNIRMTSFLTSMAQDGRDSRIGSKKHSPIFLDKYMFHDEILRVSSKFNFHQSLNQSLQLGRGLIALCSADVTGPKWRSRNSPSAGAWLVPRLWGELLLGFQSCRKIHNIVPDNQVYLQQDAVPLVALTTRGSS